MIFKSVRRNLRKSQDSIVAALDVGTSKVSCAVARLEPHGGVTLLGMGFQASKGLRSGMIVDMEQLYRSVVQAINQAEDEASETIQSVYISVSSKLCLSRCVRVDLQITGHSVDENDLRKVLAQAVSSVQKKEQSVLHTIPLGYSIDGNRGIRDPRGMYGDGLQASYHLVLGLKTPLRNLAACVDRCHLETQHFACGVYASGLATLVDDELDLGVTFLDIGAGSTSIGLFYNNCFAHVDQVPIGGAHVTSDIARCFSTPMREAERIKILHGSALVSPADGRSCVLIPQIGEEQNVKGKQINKSELTAVIRPRVEELLEVVRDKLKATSAHKLAGRRLVITGGGALLPGIPELAGLILNKQTRLAKPLHITGLKEEYRTPGLSTCIGLLIYARNQNFNLKTASALPANENTVGGSISKIGTWIKENF